MEQKTWLSTSSFLVTPHQKHISVASQFQKLRQMQVLGLAMYSKHAAELANSSSGFPLLAIGLHGFTGKTSLDELCHLNDRLFDNLF